MTLIQQNHKLFIILKGQKQGHPSKLYGSDLIHIIVGYYEVHMCTGTGRDSLSTYRVWGCPAAAPADGRPQGAQPLEGHAPRYDLKGQCHYISKT